MKQVRPFWKAERMDYQVHKRTAATDLVHWMKKSARRSPFAATVTAAVSTSGKEFEGRRVLLRGAIEGAQTLTGQVVSTRRALDKGFTSPPCLKQKQQKRCAGLRYPSPNPDWPCIIARLLVRFPHWARQPSKVPPLGPVNQAKGQAV